MLSETGECSTVLFLPGIHFYILGFAPSSTSPHVTRLQGVVANLVICKYNINKLNLFVYLIETKSILSSNNKDN
jgi:hypothetical protein